MFPPSVALLRAFASPHHRLAASITTPLVRRNIHVKPRTCSKFTSQFSTPSPYTNDPPAQDAPPSIGPKPKRSLRPLIWAAFFLLIGLTTGRVVSAVIIPPPLPVPNTPDDEMLLSYIRSQSDALPIVKELSSDPAWTSWDAYSSFTPEEKERRLSSGPLGGARGLGVQRIFWNEATGEARTVVWIGGATTGWPGVVHGGCLATLLDESLGRIAVRRFKSRSGESLLLFVCCRRHAMGAFDGLKPFAPRMSSPD